jgi:uracil-DNA glycosylase
LAVLSNAQIFLPLTVGCCSLIIILAVGVVAWFWMWKRKGKKKTVEEQRRKWKDENIEGMKDAEFEEL